MYNEITNPHFGIYENNSNNLKNSDENNYSDQDFTKS